MLALLNLYSDKFLTGNTNKALCLSKVCQDDKSTAILSPRNGDVTETDMTSFRESTTDNMQRNDCDFDTDTQSFTKATVDERYATLKLKNGHDVEVCTSTLCQPAEEDLNVLALSTGIKHAFSTEKDTSNSEILTDAGSDISVCMPEDAGHAVRDIPVDEGVPSEDKLPIVSGCTVVIKELSNSKTSVANKRYCYNNSAETRSEQLKMVVVKDKECNPTEQRPSVVDIKKLRKDELPQLNEDDKDMLEEAFILQSLTVEEKHVCITLDWHQNVKQHETVSMLAAHTNESGNLSSGEKESIYGVSTEDDERDIESATVSSCQKDSIFQVRASSGEGDSGFDASSLCSTNSLDIQSGSSIGRNYLSVDNLVKNVIAVPHSAMAFSRNGYSGLGSGTRSGSSSVVSQDNYVCGSPKITSLENYSVESSEVEDANKKDEAQFSNGCSLENSMNENTWQDSKNNFPLQAAVELSFALTESISPVAANTSLTTDLVTEGCSGEVKCLLKPEEVDEKTSESFLSNPRMCQQDPVGQTIVAAEDKSTLDVQSSLAVSHSVSHSRKSSNGTCDSIENLLTDSVVNCAVSKTAENNILGAALVGQSQRIAVPSGLAGNAVLKRNSGESAVAAEQKSTHDGQKFLAVVQSKKDNNGAWEMTEESSTDSVAINCAALQKSVVNNISTPALVENNRTKNVESQTQSNVVTSGFAGHSVSQAQSFETGRNASSTYIGQRLHEPFSNAYDEVDGNNEAAELANYTHSGSIASSGLISYSEPRSYSGPIPFSGNISLRSDSSTTSTRSFAFPILASEWNSSPVKMGHADPRYYKKKRRWQFLCFCAGVDFKNSLSKDLACTLPYTTVLAP
eukprot:Gb_36330 [translate_table: standard]